MLLMERAMQILFLQRQVILLKSLHHHLYFRDVRPAVARHHLHDHQKGLYFYYSFHIGRKNREYLFARSEMQSKISSRPATDNWVIALLHVRLRVKFMLNTCWFLELVFLNSLRTFCHQFPSSISVILHHTVHSSWSFILCCLHSAVLQWRVFYFISDKKPCCPLLEITVLPLLFLPKKI